VKIMRLAPGDKLGPYEILAPIGKGGMGEVYRGTDTRLGRPVAIKVSAREFNDRFEREARAISALNHPNICTLYDVGPNYLVMELVEGELLSKIIERGPLPLDKALSYAVQIVDALAAAHAKGVIHRDLKPGNIIITKNGVKVLDFGLAKLSSEKLSGDSAMNIETVTEPITRAGAVLGTLYYMAPEQVEGKDTDERSDIFSFGVVLYEMITGQRPFNGDTQAAVLAAVLKDPPPPMSQQPNQRQPAQSQSMPPRALERVVRRCLEKKPEDRWRSAEDLKRTLELIDLDAPPPATSTASVPIPVQTPPQKQRWLWPSIGAAVVVALAAVAAWALWLKPSPPARASRFEVPLPPDVQFDQYVSVSPDGHKLVFNATGAQAGLWIRDLDTLEWRRLAGTENGRSPFWSPDSRYLGFGVGNQLKKVDIGGGPPQTLCTSMFQVGSGVWNRDGVIVFGGFGGGTLQRVSSGGGIPAALTAGNGSLPSFLPDQKHLVYFGRGGMHAASIDAKPEDQPKELILANATAAVYSDGNMFLVRDGTLMVQAFDAAKLQLRGEPAPVAENVGTILSNALFSVSPAGVLVYRTGSAVAGLQAAWFDRTGKATNAFGQTSLDQGLELSPDGTHAAGRDVAQPAIGDIWLLDLIRSVRTPLTFHRSAGSYPVWTPDGKSIIFSVGEPPDAIYEKAASGAGDEKELFKQQGEANVPSSVSRDGRFLLYTSVLTTKTGSDLWVLPLNGAPGAAKPTLLLGTQFDESDASFSPDGRWVAYRSNQSGRIEIYVRPFVASGPALGEGQWPVSRDGAVSQRPRWSNDGKEIVFMGPKAMMAVEVNGSGAGFQMGTPQQLFTVPVEAGWDVTPDGKRFLMSVAPGVGQQTQTPITVVLNWQADLKR
jgi:eukaryotic-like serine/threonine-protein kinase